MFAASWSQPARCPAPPPQTLWGYQLQRRQAARVALAAGVGPDLPDGCRAWLERCGVRTGALVLHPGSETPRAWQILELDGRRHEVRAPGLRRHGSTRDARPRRCSELVRRASPPVSAQIWRTPFDEHLVAMLRPSLATLPPAYRQAAACHVGVHPNDPSLPLLAELRAAAGAHGACARCLGGCDARAALPGGTCLPALRPGQARHGCVRTHPARTSDNPHLQAW